MFNKKNLIRLIILGVICIILVLPTTMGISNKLNNNPNIAKAKIYPYFIEPGNRNSVFCEIIENILGTKEV